MKNMLAFVLAAVLVSSGNAFPLRHNNGPVSVLSNSIPFASSSPTYVTSGFTSLPSKPSETVDTPTPTNTSVYTSVPSTPEPTSDPATPTNTSVFTSLPSKPSETVDTPTPTDTSVYTSLPSKPSQTASFSTYA